MSEKANYEKILSIYNNFIVGFIEIDPIFETLVNNERVFIREGDLTKICRKSNQIFRFWLFNDILIYGQLLPAGKYKWSRGMNLLSITVQKHVSEIFPHAFEILGAEKSFVVIASNPNELDSWMNSIQQTADQYRLKQGVTSTPYSNQNKIQAAIWIPDSIGVNCCVCNTAFNGFLNRKHHCRQCGYVVCGDHSKSRKVLPHIDQKKGQRVCDNCFKKPGVGKDTKPLVQTQTQVQNQVQPQTQTQTQLSSQPQQDQQQQQQSQKQQQQQLQNVTSSNDKTQDSRPFSVKTSQTSQISPQIQTVNEVKSSSSSKSVVTRYKQSILDRKLSNNSNSDDTKSISSSSSSGNSSITSRYTQALEEKKINSSSSPSSPLSSSSSSTTPKGSVLSPKDLIANKSNDTKPKTNTPTTPISPTISTNSNITTPTTNQSPALITKSNSTTTPTTTITPQSNQSNQQTQQNRVLLKAKSFQGSNDVPKVEIHTLSTPNNQSINPINTNTSTSSQSQSPSPVIVTGSLKNNPFLQQDKKKSSTLTSNTTNEINNNSTKPLPGKLLKKQYSETIVGSNNQISPSNKNINQIQQQEIKPINTIVSPSIPTLPIPPSVPLEPILPPPPQVPSTPPPPSVPLTPPPIVNDIPPPVPSFPPPPSVPSFPPPSISIDLPPPPPIPSNPPPIDSNPPPPIPSNPAQNILPISPPPPPPPPPKREIPVEIQQQQSTSAPVPPLPPPPPPPPPRRDIPNLQNSHRPISMKIQHLSITDPRASVNREVFQQQLQQQQQQQQQQNMNANRPGMLNLLAAIQAGGNDLKHVSVPLNDSRKSSGPNANGGGLLSMLANVMADRRYAMTDGQTDECSENSESDEWDDSDDD